MIYFIQAKQYVKIGYSRNPQYRLKKMQTANPVKLKLLATMPGDCKTEKGLHEAFVGKHYRGEWFRYSGNLKASIMVLRGDDSANTILIEDVRSFQQSGIHLRARQKFNRLQAAGKRHHKFVDLVKKYSKET